MMIKNLWQQARNFTKVRESVKNAFGKNLLFTNTWTSGALMFAGDILEQEIEYRKKLIPVRYDWWRVGRMTIIGIAFGPLFHYFYLWLDKTIPQRTFKAVTQKNVIDQVILSPACIVLFIYGAAALEGNTFKSSTQELKEKFVEIYLLCLLMWVPIQYINFFYLPVKYQVLYVNGFTVIYNVFLSYIKHRDQLLPVTEVNS